MSKPFYFKKFAVQQDRCAMKVGTDGVLLGAWAKMPANAQSVLDIGTGTGVIALMMAQRFLQANVLGIDIAVEAVQQATDNFKQSVFASQLTAQHCALQDFSTEQKFDSIVSNPPFFTNGVLPTDEQRKLARHTAEFSFEMLFEKIATLLAERGILSVIIPIEQGEKLIKIAQEKELFCTEYCTVFPNPNKLPKRLLLAFSLQKLETQYSEITIETHQRHCYTEMYKAILKDFYLAF